MKKMPLISALIAVIVFVTTPTVHSRNNPLSPAGDSGLSSPWVVYASALGWVRIGTMAEFEARWKKRDEIWGGRSEEALDKTLLRKGYETREQAVESLCRQLTRVKLDVAPATKPARYMRAVFEGKEYNLWLTPGFSDGAVKAMIQGKAFKRNEYDWKKQWDVLKKHHITPRFVFKNPQWLIHAIERGTRQGPERLDRWMCFTRSPDENKRFTMPLADGTRQTYTADKWEGPFRDSFSMARAMEQHGIKSIDLWPPVTSATRRDVQARVNAEMIPKDAKDYGDGALPQQPILPVPSLEDWVIYSVEGGWLHVATRHEFKQPWMKSEVIWGGTGEEVAKKNLLAPEGDGKFHSRKQALAHLCEGLKDVTTQYHARSRPRETIVGTFQGKAYKLRLDRGLNGENVLVYKSKHYDYGTIWKTLKQAGITPLRRFGKMRLVHSTGHGTISGPVKDDIYMLVPSETVGADGKRMKLPDGLGGWFIYTVDYVSKELSTNYELSPLLRQLAGGNANLAKKLGSVKIYAQDRHVSADEVPPNPSNQGGAYEKSRVVLYRLIPAEARPGDYLGITILADGIEKGAKLELGKDIALKDLAYGGRDGETEHHLWYCTVDIEENAKPGPRSLTVTNLDGAGNTLAGFKVVAEEAPPDPLPPLPLVIPAAGLEGRLKERLVDIRSKIKESLREIARLKAERAALVSAAQHFNSLAMLAAWYLREGEILVAEKDARLAAESFFKILGAVYDRLSDTERGEVEQGLSKRAFALRRDRTVQRRLIRERSGLGTIDSDREFRVHFEALARQTWCNLELDSLIRMWGAVNTARLLLHGRYDPYWMGEADVDPNVKAAVDRERRRHFEALVDLGISSLLGSESRYEAVMDARKDRLYGLRQWWRQTGRDFKDPRESRAAGGVLVQLFSLGFSLFDVVCGLGADAIKGGIYHTFGADFRTRAEKLEDLAMKNWEKTQRKLLLLRLLRRLPLDRVEKMAGDVATGSPVEAVPIAPGKIDADDIRSIMDDRAFSRATGGGLLKILGVTLTTFNHRCAMELVIAKDQTRLLHRDTLAAYRLEKGQDAETGETTWGTILSPMTWADLASKKLFQEQNFNLRSGHIDRLKQQDGVMGRFIKEDVLLDVDFDFTRLAEKDLVEHVKLCARSAPYVQFVIRVTEERAVLTFHRWATTVRDLSEHPGILKKLTTRLGQFKTTTNRKNRVDLRRKQNLDYEDLVYAWDLSGALALAKQLAPAAPTYRLRVKLLLDAVATESVKSRGIDLFRNVGDMGVNAAVMGLGGRLLGFGGPAAAGGAQAGAGAAQAAAGVAAEGAKQQSFARYVYGVLNPLSQGPGEIIEEAVTEVTTDIGVSVAGEKYEDLINKVAELVIARLFDLVKAQIEAGEGNLGDEKNRNPYLDPQQFEGEYEKDPVEQEAQALAEVAERKASESNPDVKDSIDRQSEEKGRSYAGMLMSFLYYQHAQAAVQDVKKADDNAKKKAPEYARHTQQARTVVTPEAIVEFEKKIKDRKADLFAAGKGLDIGSLRAKLKLLIKTTQSRFHPLINTLLIEIDAERTGKIKNAMGRFYAKFGAKVEGVILNGTQEGNPEYKRVFSDRDLTVVVSDPKDIKAVQKGLIEAFKEEGITLNLKGKQGSADVEVMVQKKLPGDIEAITTKKELMRWFEKMPRDPTRYLSTGGSVWVGFYNALSGGTMSYAGGEAVIDARADSKMLPKPPVSPLVAHGIVLDVARYDKLQDVFKIKTDDAAEMMGARSRNVLRAVDALIWAKATDLVRARTRQDALKKGYHALIVEDARVMVKRGLLTPGEFKTIQILADLKRGKTLHEALGLDPAKGEANRPRVVQIWNEADGLMKKAYNGTREVYLKQIHEIASGQLKDPEMKKLLFTVVFRNWNAARQIDDPDNPGKLKHLTGKDADAALNEMKDQDRLAMDHIEGLDDPPAPPRPPDGADPDPDDMVPGDPGDRRPAEGSDPDPAPTAVDNVAPRAPPGDPPFEKIFESFSEAEIPADTKKNLPEHDPDGRAIGFAKEVLDDPFEAVNEAVAFEFGRQLDCNVPLTEVVFNDNGEIIGGIMRFVPGHNLAAYIDGKDIFSGTEVKLPDGMTMEGLLKQPEFRRQYIMDKILSAIMGDFDRRAMNQMLTPDGKLVPVDHAAAQPIPRDDNGNRLPITPENIVNGLKEHLQAPAEAARRRKKPKHDLDQVMNITWEEIAPILKEAKGKMTAEFLDRAAARYGPDSKPQVLDTWNMRIAHLEDVMKELYSASPGTDTSSEPPTTHGLAAPLPSRKGTKPAPVRRDESKSKDGWEELLSPDDSGKRPTPSKKKEWEDAF